MVSGVDFWALVPWFGFVGVLVLLGGLVWLASRRLP
jgi:hypothetical protein